MTQNTRRGFIAKGAAVVAAPLVLTTRKAAAADPSLDNIVRLAGNIAGKFNGVYLSTKAGSSNLGSYGDAYGCSQDLWTHLVNQPQLWDAIEAVQNRLSANGVEPITSEMANDIYSVTPSLTWAPMEPGLLWFDGSPLPALQDIQNINNPVAFAALVGAHLDTLAYVSGGSEMSGLGISRFLPETSFAGPRAMAQHAPTRVEVATTGMAVGAGLSTFGGALVSASGVNATTLLAAPLGAAWLWVAGVAILVGGAAYFAYWGYQAMQSIQAPTDGKCYGTTPKLIICTT